MTEEIIKTLKQGCLVCGAEEAHPILVKEGMSFVRCVRCGLIYQNLPSSPETSREFYERHYYEDFGDRASLIQRARLSLYRSFLSECLGTHRRGRLLDIGSGYGDFLKMAESDGWEGWGIEPSLEAGESSRQILGERVLNQTLESADFPQGHFDVITLWNVLDCLLDPRGALARIHRWLSPDGLLFIRTPNAFFHLGIYRFYKLFRPLLERLGWKKEASVFLRANFNASCLKRLLAETGFSDIRIENGMPTEGDAYRVSSHGPLVKIAKGLVFSIARGVSTLTGNRLFIGSNLVAKASKGVTPPLRIPPATLAIQSRIILKTLFLHLLALLGYLLGLPLWRKLSGKDREIRILRYHGVSEYQTSDLNVKESAFKKQLQLLSRRYSVISLEEAVKSMKEGILPAGRPVAITFDDGYQNNYEVAYPLLKAQGMSAAIFLLTGGEGPTPFDRLLQWDQVRILAASGTTFGSHGRRHVHLGGLSAGEVRHEMVSSKEKIESETHQAVRFFSYPYGTSLDFDEETKRLARESGYEAAFSAIFGTNGPLRGLLRGPRRDRFALRRIGIEASDTQFTFQAKLNGAIDLLSLFDLRPLRRIIRWVDTVFLKTVPPPSPKKRPFLLVSVDFPPHKDGISTISRELAARIAARGEKMFVIGPRDPGDHKFDAGQGYRVFRVPGYDWGYLRFLPLLLATPWVVFRYGIRKIFAMSVSYGGILSWLLSFFSSLEYIVFAHGYEFEKVRKFPLAHRLYLKIFRCARKVITNSRAVRDRLLLFGVPSEKVEVLHPAVDSEWFHPREVPDEYLAEKGLKGRKILLTVGRLIKRKGHDQMLEALPLIRECFPNVLYCIVGIGPEEKAIRDRIHSLNLEGHVHLWGRVSDEELVLLYNACEIFVMPSREIPEGGHIEGFGIVYLEANACGKPVIGGRSGGVGEAIQDGETGFLVDPARPEEIAGKVIEFLSRPERAEEMGACGLRRVRQAFNWEQYVDQAYQWLEERPLP